jgi:hypothetical protein
VVKTFQLAVEAALANATSSPCTSWEGSPIVASVYKASAPPALPHSKKRKRAYVSNEEDSESDDDDEHEDACTNPKPKGSSLYCYFRNGIIWNFSKKSMCTCCIRPRTYFGWI